ncbi:MAG: hydrolase, partial [Bacteroides sp.]
MSHLQNKKSLALKDLLYKALLLIGTVAVIVYFLPREGKFNYEFDVNKPWKYGQLIATFDFPIYKDSKVIKREQDSLLASFQPYYQLQKETEKKVLGRLKENHQDRMKNILPSIDYLRYIERTLKEIYSAGIVSTDEMSLLQKDSSRSVMIIEDKLANPRTVQSLFTVKEAYEYLLSNDTVHYKRDILRQCALNDYILPNLTFDKERTDAAKKDILSSYSMSDGMVVT